MRFKIKESKRPINFGTYLSLLAVFSKGTHRERVNAFIDIHDLDNLGYFDEKEQK